MIDVNNFKIPFGYEYGDNDENEDLIKDLFDSNTGRVVRHGYIHYQNRLRIANCQLLGVTADRDIQPPTRQFFSGRPEPSHPDRWRLQNLQYPWRCPVSLLRFQHISTFLSDYV